MPLVRELLSREEIQAPEAPSDTPAMATGRTTAKLLDACCRLVDLLNTPQDIPYLGGLIQREIIYRILRGREGARLRAIATLGDQSHRTAKGFRGSGGTMRSRYEWKISQNRVHGRVHTALPFPGADRHESSSVSKATSIACSSEWILFSARMNRRLHDLGLRLTLSPVKPLGLRLGSLEDGSETHASRLDRPSLSISLDRAGLLADTARDRRRLPTMWE
jgi:hypothetical protein